MVVTEDDGDVCEDDVVTTHVVTPLGPGLGEEPGGQVGGGGGALVVVVVPLVILVMLVIDDDTAGSQRNPSLFSQVMIFPSPASPMTP